MDLIAHRIGRALVLALVCFTLAGCATRIPRQTMDTDRFVVVNDKAERSTRVRMPNDEHIRWRRVRVRFVTEAAPSPWFSPSRDVTAFDGRTFTVSHRGGPQDYDIEDVLLVQVWWPEKTAGQAAGDCAGTGALAIVEILGRLAMAILCGIA